MTDEQLQEIEDRANNATAGPWFYYSQRGTVESHHDYQDTGKEIPICRLAQPMGDRSYPNPDGHFVAMARTDIPALIAEVRKLRSESAGNG